MRFGSSVLGAPLAHHRAKPGRSQMAVPPCSCELLKYYNLSKAKKVEQRTRFERNRWNGSVLILFLAKSTAGGGGTASFFSLLKKRLGGGGKTNSTFLSYSLSSN